ncbi:MAG: LLM class F420-dependent oxidoreductase [Porticoccaceae bacterium]
MQVGITQVLANSQADPAVVARRAEELGFESYWLPDHTILPVQSTTRYPGSRAGAREPDTLWQIPDPLIALSRAAAVTSRLKLGTGICLVPERNPILLAKQIATLDDHSGGRFLFGIGAGWNREECEILGGDFDHRWTQVKEYIDAMKVLWQQDISEFHGRYVDFPPVRCFPKPAAKPYPPILLGNIGSPHALRRVVEWGDGWMPVIRNVEEFAAGVQDIRKLADQAGRDIGTLDFTVFGMHGQFRNAEDIRALARVGAGRVILWLKRLDLDGILSELEELAGLVLR